MNKISDFWNTYISYVMNNTNHHYLLHYNGPEFECNAIFSCFWFFSTQIVLATFVMSTHISKAFSFAISATKHRIHFTILLLFAFHFIENNHKSVHSQLQILKRSVLFTITRYFKEIKQST